MTIYYIQKDGYKYPLKFKYVVKSRANLITTWGTYSLYEFENMLFITKRSYSETKNSDKVYIVTRVPKYMISELIIKKRMNSKYLDNLCTELKIMEKEGINNNF